jgi:hypothetical protein
MRRIADSGGIERADGSFLYQRLTLPTLTAAEATATRRAVSEV